MFFLNLSRTTQAQQPTTILISTTYKTRADLDFLFGNSSIVLKYLEGEEIEEPVFLALVTPLNRLKIERQGLPVQVIDENPDLTRYKFYFTYESGHGDKLSKFGTVTILNSHHTLLRLPETAPADFHVDGFDIEFFESPLTGPLPSPKYQTATITRTPTINESPIPARTSGETKKPKVSTIILLTVGIIFIVASFIIAITIFRKQQY